MLARPRKWLTPLFALGLAAITLGSYGATLAVWNDQAPTTAAIVVAGDLDLATGDDTMTWTQTSPYVAGTPNEIDPQTFLSTPGDTFTASQDFTTTLDGDNMNAILTVRWATDPDLPDGVTATFGVTNSDGDIIAEGAVGTSVTVESDLLNGDGSTYTLSAYIDYAESADDVFLGEDVPVIDLGQIEVLLDQQREGEGF